MAPCDSQKFLAAALNIFQPLPGIIDDLSLIVLQEFSALVYITQRSFMLGHHLDSAQAQSGTQATIRLKFWKYSLLRKMCTSCFKKRGLIFMRAQEGPIGTHEVVVELERNTRETLSKS